MANKRLPLAIGLGISGWLLIDAALKGESPLDRLATIFTGAEPKGRLATAGITPGTTGTTPNTNPQTGFGTLELLGPWNEPKKHSGHLHWAHSNPDVVVKVGLELMALGYSVGEHPRFGGVAGSCNNDPHVVGSYHCKSRAIDINWNGWGDERLKLWEAAGYITSRVKELATAGANSPGGGVFVE